MNLETIILAFIAAVATCFAAYMTFKGSKEDVDLNRSKWVDEKIQRELTRLSDKVTVLEDRDDKRDADEALLRERVHELSLIALRLSDMPDDGRPMEEIVDLVWGIVGADVLRPVGLGGWIFTDNMGGQLALAGDLFPSEEMPMGKILTPTQIAQQRSRLKREADRIRRNAGYEPFPASDPDSGK